MSGIIEPRKFSLFQTYDKPRGQGGSGSFATFLIIGPTCFFLGAIFSSFPYDFPLLWTRVPPTPAFYDQLETHIKLLYHSPAVVVRIGQIVAVTGFIGFFTKLFKPSEANLLFDGASLGLYMVALIVFVSNTLKGFRIVNIGKYEAPPDVTDTEVLGREDSLRVLAASNTILALLLVGVLVLQAGQWYAEKKEQQEVEKFEAEAKQAGKAVGKSTGRETRSASGKKKQ